MYMLLSRHQNTGQNHDKERAKRFFEDMKFTYSGTTVINQNLIREEIKRGLNLANACNHSVQNLFLLVRCLKKK
jgi:hypothetical protein